MGEDIRVLVVDEDIDVLDLTKAFLERESDAISVVGEQRPANVVERVQNEDIDCVVSDYRMPGLDGLELFDALREQDIEIPFYLLTAASESEVATAAEDAGVSGFIQKGTGTDHYIELAESIETTVEE